MTPSRLPLKLRYAVLRTMGADSGCALDLMDNWPWTLCPALPSSFLKRNDAEMKDINWLSLMDTLGLDLTSTPSSDLEIS
jgi:hypothetical protein